MASPPGKVALITGATSGIGEATARRLARAGCQLALIDQDQDELTDLATQCQKLGISENQILLLAGDLTEDDNVEEAVRRTVEKFGKLDILIFNLMWDDILGDKDKAPITLFDETIRVNVRSVYYLTKLAAPHLISTKGCIINNYNVPTFTSGSEKVVYVITKSILDQFMRSVAVELAPKNVRINSINPGTSSCSQEDENRYSHLRITPACKEEHPLGRHSKDKEVAAAIGYLASHGATMVTGDLITMDSGRHICPGAPKD